MNAAGASAVAVVTAAAAPFFRRTPFFRRQSVNRLTIAISSHAKSVIPATRDGWQGACTEGRA